MKNIGLTACYYNPCNFSLRKENYLRFYDSLGSDADKFLTVELAFDDAEFHLEHLPNRIALRSSNVLWQKEALLNIGIRELVARGFDYIVWLDADIKFHNEDWYEKLSEGFDTGNLIQVFKNIKRFDDEDNFTVMKGTAASIGNVSPATGFGWGCPASYFQDGLGLYDSLIIGGGDTLIYAAGNGELQAWLQKRKYSLSHIEHIVAWSNLWYDKVQGKVGYADNRIDTFYHGTLKNRNYLNRHELLLRNEFNPNKDVVLDDSGLLQWNSDKPEMHNALRKYFAARQEDG
jgi:hypothetical protein